MSRAAEPTTTEVDARGLRCPLPVIRLAEAARDAPAGAEIIVLATDPATRYDIPAWCRMRGHELRDTAETPARSDDPAYLRFLVLIRAQPSNAGGAGTDSERRSRER